MDRRDISRVLLGTAAGAALLSQRAQAQTCTAPCYAQTADESSAGVVPSDFSREPGPIADARRYGFSSAASASTNTLALQAAIQSLPPGNASIRGGTVQLPPGLFALNDVVIPQYVRVCGAGRGATTIQYAGSGACFSLGSSAATGVLKYGCTVADLSVVLSNGAGRAVQLVETVGAVVARLYLEGALVVGRSNIGVAVDGGTASSFFNRIDDVICNHMHIGYKLLTSAGQRTSQNFFSNCTSFGDGTTYGLSRGLVVDPSEGDGTVWIGGNIENCHIGVFPNIGALSVTMIGTRFEGNYLDITSGTGQQPWTFIGINTDTEYNVSDLNGVFTFVGCTTTTSGPWINRFSGAIRTRRIALPFSGSITPSVQYGNEFSISATSGGAFTMNAPTQVPDSTSDGHLLRVMIRNVSGGALGAVSWNPIYRLGSWTQPANGFSRSIEFRYDLTNWVEVSRTPIDVPN